MQILGCSRLRLIWLFLLCCSFISLRAQQNFFNVPSSDITPAHQVFAQQQLNVFSGILSSNTTFCYGMGKGFELGLNVLGVTYSTLQHKLVSSARWENPVFPSFGLNAQKRIWEQGVYSFSLGGQLLSSRSWSNLELYIYANNRWQFSRLKIIAGMYGGNVHYFGTPTLFSSGIRNLGVQGGLEYQIIREKLFFQVDFVSGRTSISNLIPGAAYKFSQHLILSAGYQFPNDASNSSKGFIAELTYVP